MIPGWKMFTSAVYATYTRQQNVKKKIKEIIFEKKIK